MHFSVPIVKWGRQEAVMAEQELLLKLRNTKETHSQWKQGQVTRAKYRDMVQMFRDGIRKAEPQLEQNLAKDGRITRRDFIHSSERRLYSL